MENALSPPKKRVGTTVVSSYLLLKKEDQICLLLRKNTGYHDGCFGLIAGHVEDGESATEGMVREAYEEAGITLSPSQLRVVHILHRKTKENRLCIDVFFETDSWDGKLENREPHKCEKLAFYRTSALPVNTIQYLVDVMKAIAKGQFYSEMGWNE